MFASIARVGVGVAVFASVGLAQDAEFPVRVLDASDDGSWWVMSAPTAAQEAAAPWVRPNAFATVEMLPEQLRDRLAAAPMEFTGAQPLIIDIPNPDGGFTAFELFESPVMHPDLQARYPEIRTYAGHEVGDASSTVRISMTPAGFAAQVLSPDGAWYIDRYSRHDDTLYASYTRRDISTDQDWQCHTVTPDVPVKPQIGGDGTALRSSGSELRTYRCAIACTGEYASFHGGTVPSALAAIVVALNRVTGIYEVDVAVRMELIPNNDLIVYTNAGSDPYTNNDGFSMLGQNVSNLSSVIGNANFDIGHVFSTGGGGVAGLGVVCGSSKARGVTGQNAPIGDPFYVDYVAHEMGHQYGGNHTFNGVNGACSGGNRNGGTAYEPGSATTIQGYAGICGADNLANNSDPYFHSISYDEMRAHVTSTSCAVITATGNSEPSVSAGPSYTIPIDTPFELTASGSDADGGDVLTYCWEQRDLGPAISLATPDNGSSPLFRSFIGTTNPTRTFPRLSNILNDTNTIDEHMPMTNRTMTFRVTVRDNALGGGGVDFAETSVTSTTSAGPFEVTSYNSGGSFAGVLDVTWDVAGTNAGAVNTPNVDIYLSTDGGQTFPFLLASATANDGAETVGIPVASSTARIKVKGSGNAFFDINNSNIDVQPSDVVILLPSGSPSQVAPGVATTFPIEIQPGTGTLVPGTGTLHYRFDGGAFQTAALSALGGDDFEATLPAANCADTPEFYVSAESSTGTTVTNPTAGPAGPYSAIVGVDVQLISDNAETDIGWTVSGDATDGQWDRGVPVNAGRGDPASDADGSGQAWLTDNDSGNGGNSDVDNGQTILTSPSFDLSLGATVSYQYWLNDFTNGELNGDSFDVDISLDDGTNWTNVRSYTTAALSWRSDSIGVGTETGTSSTVRFRFIAEDVGNQNITEGGLDDFVISRFECEDTNPACGPADITTQGSGSGDPGYGVPDGAVTGADINYYINFWVAGDVGVADVTTQGAGAGDPGFGVPDGVVTAADVNYYVNLWIAGCP
jgi:hypothetical protein